MLFKTLACPDCGQPARGSLQALTGVSEFSDPDEVTGEVEFSGTTDLNWDEMKTIRQDGGVVLVCRCGCTWPSREADLPADGSRIVATFVPQAWVNDFAVTVDPEGPTQFDVSEAVLALGREAALKLRDDQYETDELREHGPHWVRNWPGPFKVEVEDSIRAYFDRQGEMLKGGASC